MEPELQHIQDLHQGYITQFGSPPDIMTVPSAAITVLDESPFFKRTSNSSVGTIGKFMGMQIRIGGDYIATNIVGSQTLEIGELNA